MCIVRINEVYVQSRIRLPLRFVETPVLRERAVTVGVLLGLGLLTKAYFLTAIPATALIFLMPLTGLRKPLWRPLGIVLLVALSISGWWYTRADPPVP